ncbi:MAG: hypothetical protein Q7U02_09245, partial [Desulfosalsimonadaceae bacterium]|nr:hypothetical protein [Desulfosalsimonadaceae bacterium]
EAAGNLRVERGVLWMNVFPLFSDEMIIVPSIPFWVKGLAIARSSAAVWDENRRKKIMRNSFRILCASG